MSKFTNQELSTLLSEHELGQLKRYGAVFFNKPYCDYYNGKFKLLKWSSFNPRACLMQVIKNQHDAQKAAFSNSYLSHRFDIEYNDSWTTDQFLKWLETL